MANERYVAVQDTDSELWGVEGADGGILYESDIASQAQATFMAVYHTNNPDAEFERDVWPAWVEYLAKTDSYESALLYAETAPQYELISLIINHRKVEGSLNSIAQFITQLGDMMAFAGSDLDKTSFFDVINKANEVYKSYLGDKSDPRHSFINALWDSTESE